MKYSLYFLTALLLIIYLWDDHSQNTRSGDEAFAFNARKIQPAPSAPILKKANHPSMKPMPRSGLSKPVKDLNPLTGPEKEEVIRAVLNLSSPEKIASHQDGLSLKILTSNGVRAKDTIIFEVICDCTEDDKIPDRPLLIDFAARMSQVDTNAREKLIEYIISKPNLNRPKEHVHNQILDRLEAFEKMTMYDEQIFAEVFPKITELVLKKYFVHHYEIGLTRKGYNEEEAQEKARRAASYFL